MNHTLITHSILRWAVLILGLWTIINAVAGITGKKAYTNKDNKVNLFFMISCDIQLLLGLILYFKGVWFNALKENTAVVMKDASLRFFAVEHVTMMLMAWVLVHVARVMVKKAPTDAQKHKRSLILFGVALVIILAMIPWPFKQPGIARALFPQF